MKLTETHLEILDRGATGQQINWEARWVCNGRPVTRQVKALKRNGLVETTWYRNGGATSPTEAGREALAKSGYGA